MKSYSYVALDSAGLRTQGLLSAQSEPEARTILERKGLLVEFVAEAVGAIPAAPRVQATQSAVTPTMAAQSQNDPSWSQTIAAKYEPEALAHLYRQVAALMKSGVPLVTAFGSISGGAYSPRVRSAVTEIRDAAQQGETISSVFERRKDVFPGFHTALLRAGEKGGFVDDALTQLADYLRQEIEMRNRWKAQTFYPKLLLAFMFIVIFATNAAITYFAGKTGGPRLYLTNFLLDPWIGIPILALVVIIFLWLRSARSSYKAARFRDEFALWLPYYGSTAQMHSIAKFSRSLSLLFAGGVPIREAVLLSADASGNIVVAEQIKPLANKLNEGSSIWDALRQSGFFTHTALDIIKAGELSGSLQSLLDHLAFHYEEEGKVRMAKFTTVLTMVTILVIVLVVASTIISFWLNYMPTMLDHVE